MKIRNKCGFVVEDVNLNEIATYIKKLPVYKDIVKKIKSTKIKIKKCTKPNIKVQLRSILNQLKEKQRQIITTSFYIKYPNLSVIYDVSKRRNRQ
jgi:DNA-directed RNA polymerase sigma subunit (sigma70/sigma32)